MHRTPSVGWNYAIWAERTHFSCRFTAQMALLFTHIRTIPFIKSLISVFLQFMTWTPTWVKPSQCEPAAALHSVTHVCKRHQCKYTRNVRLRVNTLKKMYFPQIKMLSAISILSLSRCLCHICLRTIVLFLCDVDHFLFYFATSSCCVMSGGFTPCFWFPTCVSSPLPFVYLTL